MRRSRDTLFDLAIGSRSLGWADAQGSGRRTINMLPRQLGEPYTDYSQRFFREIRGLGHVFLYKGTRRIGRRGF